MTREEKILKIQLLEEKERRIRASKIFTFQPYEYQKRFFASGAKYTQRMLMAANQIGKSECANYEMAYHLTGLYPEWWEGLRFDFAPVVWAVGKSGEWVRDNTQVKLLGEISNGVLPFQYGGIINPELIASKPIRGMIPNSIKSAEIKHVTGGVSKIFFKAYDQGQHALMGPTVDYINVDEEPKDPTIYGQLLIRTVAGNRKKGGCLTMVFTPENGMTRLVSQYMNERTEKQYLQTATWDDAPHLTEEAKKSILAAMPEHQREMRSKGVPLMGEGMVFTMSEDLIKEQPLELIPSFWPRILGIDFGWDHPTALVWCAYDRDNDVIHVYDCWRRSKVNVEQVAGVIRGRDDNWIPVSWPHDGLQHDKGSGEQLAEQYRRQGVEMLPRRATFEDGSNGVEAGISEMRTRFETGRLKVASHLSDWFAEFRMYHYSGAKIVKEDDDLLSATRYAMMMLRYADTKPVYNQNYDDDYPKETWY